MRILGIRRFVGGTKMLVQKCSASTRLEQLSSVEFTRAVFSRRLPSSDPGMAVRELLGAPAADVIDLTVTNPTRVGLSYPSEELAAALGRASFAAYAPEPQGLVVAREALVADWGARGQCVTAEDMVITASSSEAYSLLFKLLCDPGDEVLVPQPSYPLFEVLAALDGLRAVGYRLAYDGAWQIDLDSVARARSSRTRALVVVTPNNPTGSFLKRSELAALSNVGLPLIADEVFWPYPFGADPGRASSALAVADTLVFVLDGLSKRCGMPQLKLGWITLGGPAELKSEARARLELINDSYLSASTPVQQALPELLVLGERMRRQIAARCAENRSLLGLALRDSEVTPLFLEGGWSAPLRLPDTHSEDDWALSLLREQRVLVQPGWFYDFERSAFVVISLLQEPELFASGIQRLRQHVEVNS
jgi:alanine-synthesizing transaminase